MSSHYDPQHSTRVRTIQDFVYIGFNSRVVALDRDSGEIVWDWKAPQGRSSHVPVLLDGDRLIASPQGYTYCLDPITGELLWENPLKGYGLGIPSVVSLYGNTGSTAAAAIIAQQQRNSAANQHNAGMQSSGM